MFVTDKRQTTEPIVAKFFLGPPMIPRKGYECSELQKFASKILRFL